MMRSKTGLGTRVARRILGLFLLCAILPVVLAILGSYGRVQDALIEERVGQLGQAAEGYATTLLERLYLADHLSRSLAAAPAGTDRSRDELRRYFRTIAILPPHGRPELLIGSADRVPATLPTNAAIPHVAAGESMVLVATASTPARRGVWMLRAMSPSDPAAGMLATEINPEYLWGHADELPYLTSLCVLDVNRTPLYCTGVLPDSAMGALKAGLAKGPAGHSRWDNEAGDGNVGAFRELFLEAKFRGGSWPIVMWQPDEQALAPVHAVRSLVLPLVALGLLIAAFTGLVQVRRIMNPLRELSDATRRIAARDFGARLTVTGNDEFGELAEAFNAMSERLGRQFHALGALAQIDSVILSKVDIDRIGAIVLGRMKEVIKARSWWLLLADENAPGSFHVRAVDTGTESLTGRTLRFTGAELFQFQQAPQGYAMGRSGRPIPAALLPVDIESVFVLPILLGGEVGGMIVVGGARDGGPDADEIGLLQDLADRVAGGGPTPARAPQR